MATVNLGRIKPVFRGAYSGATAYVVDDIVTHGNESFICIQAHGAGTQATSQTAYWTKLAAKGADGTDVGTTITTQGDILYRDGSGLQRLAAGTSGQYLKTQGSGANPVWADVSAGALSIKQVYKTTLPLETHAGTTNTAYNFGTPLQITPAASTDQLDIRLQTVVEGAQGSYYGLAIGVNTSDSWGTTTNHSTVKQSTGEFGYGMGSGNDSERYQTLYLGGLYTLSDLGMSASTAYHVTPYMLVHSPAGQIKTGQTPTNYTGNINRFEIIRYGV